MSIAPLLAHFILKNSRSMENGYGHECKYELFDSYWNNKGTLRKEIVYVFSCKSCRRKRNVTSREILKVAKRYKEELKEKEFYGNFHDCSKTRLVIGHLEGGYFDAYTNFLIKGYVADKTIEYFERMHLDITVCHRYVGNNFTLL